MLTTMDRINKLRGLFLQIVLCQLLLSTLASVPQASICETEMCSCDEFRRVKCHCKNDAQEIVLTSDQNPRILLSASEIEIINCSRVFIHSKAIAPLRELKKINIYNVASLSLSEESLYWRYHPLESEMLMPGLVIGFHNTTLTEIPSHCMKGRIDDVIFNNSMIRGMQSFAFTNFIGLRRIWIKDSNVQNVNIQAFKKFNMELMTIENSIFNTIPSRMLSDIEMRTFRMKNTTIDRIQSSSMILNNVHSFVIEDCKINYMEGDAFRITTTGSVMFRNNTIDNMHLGAFAGFSSSKLPNVYPPLDLTFENITLASLVTGNLQVDLNSYNVIIKNLHVNQKCECKDRQNAQLSYYEKNMYCASGVSASNQIQYKPFSLYLEEYCTLKELSTVVISIISVASVLVLIIIIFIILCMFKKTREGLLNITGGNKKQNTISCDKEFPVILPDGRTYRETELHVIVEKAQLLTTDL